MTIPVTLLYASLNALLNVALAFWVTTRRWKHKESVGKLENPAVVRAVRAHGNNSEFVALAMLLLLINELSGAKSLPLHLLGGGYLAGRLMHAAGLLIPNTPLHRLGAGINYAILTTLAINALMLR